MTRRSDGYEGATNEEAWVGWNRDDFGNRGRNGRTPDCVPAQVTNNIGLVTSRSDPAQPSAVNMASQMDSQNDEGDCVDGGGRVADVEAKGEGLLEHGQQIERCGQIIRGA